MQVCRIPGAMTWNQPYLETCCRAALHRLVLAAEHGRPDGLKDGPCLARLASMGLAVRTAPGRYGLTSAGDLRHKTEILNLAASTPASAGSAPPRAPSAPPP
jgi:hypothetical protein